jgi:hypothetical protein
VWDELITSLGIRRHVLCTLALEPLSCRSNNSSFRISATSSLTDAYNKMHSVTRNNSKHHQSNNYFIFPGILHRIAAGRLVWQQLSRPVLGRCPLRISAGLPVILTGNFSWFSSVSLREFRDNRVRPSRGSRKSFGRRSWIGRHSSHQFLLYRFGQVAGNNISLPDCRSQFINHYREARGCVMWLFTVIAGLCCCTATF